MAKAVINLQKESGGIVKISPVDGIGITEVTVPESGELATKEYVDGLNTSNVKLTGNQTIAGVKTFSSTISGSVNGNSATTTKLATARTINGVAFDGTANITVVDSTKAPLDSPALIGTPTAPTAAVGTNNTQIATTAFVLANSTQNAQFASSLAANGYQKLPSGLIIQWGSSQNVADRATITVTLPLTFPNSFLNVIGQNNTGTNEQFMNGSKFTVTSKSSFTIFHVGATEYYYWLAIGY